MILQRILSWFCLTFIFLSPLLYQTQSVSAFACPATDPWCGTQVFRLKNAVSGMYLAQYWHGKRDDKRGAIVWPLDYKIGDKDVYSWYLKKAPGGYMYIINVKTGLVLYDSKNKKSNAGTWGYKPNDPKQLWKPVRQGYTNQYSFLNKATGRELSQQYRGKRHNKRQVTVEPNPYSANASAIWIREPAGRVDLLELNLISIRCVKASKGTDGATDVLFAGIEFAIESGAAFATGGGSVAATTGIKAGIKGAIWGGGKALLKKGGKSAAKAAGQAFQKVSLAGIKREFRNDAVKTAIKKAALRSGNYVAKDDADSLTELVFDTVYGDSPDDLDIHINYVSVWPKGGRHHRKISSQQTMRLNVPYYFRNEHGLYIQLVEYDSGSDNDDLGYIKFAPNAFTQTQTYFRDVLIQNKDEGSVYLLTFEVTRLGKKRLEAVQQQLHDPKQAAFNRRIRILEQQRMEKIRRQIAERDRKAAAAATLKKQQLAVQTQRQRSTAQRAAAAAMRAKAQRYAQRQQQRLAAQRAAAAAMQAKAQRYAQRQQQRLAAQRAAAKRQQLTAKQEEERWRKWAAKQDRKDRQAAARKQQAQRQARQQRQAQQRRQQAQRQAQQQQNNRRYAGVAPQRQPRSRSNRSNANSMTGHYKPLVAAHSNKCVDVENASTADNAPVVQFQCDGTPQQNFAFRPTSNGFHTIVASHSQKCLTVLNGSMANNAPIGQVRCNGSRQQMFTLIPGRNGYYNLVASHSGKCIDVPSADMGDNVRLNQFDCDNSKEQQFRH